MNKLDLLSDLYINKELPAEEYRQLPSFKELENNPVFIQKIEKYNLPEITKLICCSDILIEQPWAFKKYSTARKIYFNQFNPLSIIQEYSPDRLESNILRYCDKNLINQFSGFFEKLKNQKAELGKQQSSITKKLNKDPDNENLKKERETLISRKDAISAFLDKNKPYIFAIEKIKTLFDRDDYKEAERESIYRELNPKEVKAQESSSIIFKSGDEDFVFFLKKSIQESTFPVYSDTINKIENPDDWKWLLDKLDKNEILAISSILKEKAAQVASSIIFDRQDFSISEFFSKCENKEMGNGLFRLCLQKEKKLQRDLNFAKRKINSQSQELFSSVYLPIEKLEELSINLKFTKKDINSNIVAAQLINIVSDLRENLMAIGVDPLSDIEDWKNQNIINFDPNIHRSISKNTQTSDEAVLRTIGFQYTDDEGNIQQHKSKVSTEMVPVRKGYPKTTKPSKKKEKKS